MVRLLTHIRDIRENQSREFVTNLKTACGKTANGHGVCLKGCRIYKSNSLGLDRFRQKLKLGKIALAEMQVGQRKHIDGQQSKHLNSTAEVERRASRISQF